MTDQERIKKLEEQVAALKAQVRDQIGRVEADMKQYVNQLFHDHEFNSGHGE